MARNGPLKRKHRHRDVTRIELGLSQQRLILPRQRQAGNSAQVVNGRFLHSCSPNRITLLHVQDALNSFVVVSIPALRLLIWVLSQAISFSAAEPNSQLHVQKPRGRQRPWLTSCWRRKWVEAHCFGCWECRSRSYFCCFCSGAKSNIQFGSRCMALAEPEDETTQGIRLSGQQDPAF
jgi:hypothetical protein